MVRPRLNFETEEERREYQRQYQREYRREYRRRQQQQQTELEREQQRLTENQGCRRRYAKRSAEITVQQLEIENRDLQNADTNHRRCTSDRVLPENSQSFQVQHPQAEPSHIYDHPPNTNNQLNIDNVRSPSIERVPETPQHGSDIHVDLELQNDRENMPNPNGMLQNDTKNIPNPIGMLQSKFRRFQM